MATVSTRWNVIKKAFLSNQKTLESKSIHSHAGFGLFASSSMPLMDGFQEYIYHVLDGTIKFRIRSSVSKNDLLVSDSSGVDNTGNVCIWPSEEVLGWICLENIEKFNGKRVLELGAGSSGFAGLLIGKFGTPSYVLVTDGNPAVVKTLRENVLLNFSSNSICNCEELKWTTDPFNLAEDSKFDSIVISDCLFFTEYHTALLNILATMLKSDGFVWILGPKRGETLQKFVAKCDDFSFKVEIKNSKQYNSTIWRLHSKFIEESGYIPDLHEPILVVLQLKDNESLH